jgi:hypothetical protein
VNFKKGNGLFKLGKFEEAINEYNKIEISSPLYKYVQFNIKLAKKRALTTSSQSINTHSTARQLGKPIGFYRILGNSVGDLHVNDQAYTNLIHIVQHETMFHDVDKWFVINRLVNKSDQKKIIEYLEEHQLNYEVIDFNIDEYKQIGYDFGVLPDSSFWFQKKNNWTNLVANISIRKQKNSYLMNNNGARNFALRHGKARHKWTMPWDGNCFLSDNQFAELDENFRKEASLKYICTPMERLIDNSDVTANSKASNAVEEPQISFRYDAKEMFNEDYVYGNKPKVELFKRLDYPGKWDEYKMLYPWEEFMVDASTEAGQYAEGASVFRLSAGNSEAVNSVANRANTRVKGIADTIDRVECIYVQENIKSNSYKKMINNVFISYLKEQDLKRLQEIKDGVFQSQKEKLLFVLYMFVEDLLDDKIIEKLKVNLEPTYEGLDLKNIQIFSDKFDETLVALLIALSIKNFHISVKLKLELSMMFYFYFSHKSSKFTSKNVEFFMQITEIIFENIFNYDIANDFATINLNHNLRPAAGLNHLTPIK